MMIYSNVTGCAPADLAASLPTALVVGAGVEHISYVAVYPDGRVVVRSGTNNMRSAMMDVNGRDALDHVLVFYKLTFTEDGA